MDSFDPQEKVKENLNDSAPPKTEGISDKWLREKIDSIIPAIQEKWPNICLLYTSPSPRDSNLSRMPSSA